PAHGVEPHAISSRLEDAARRARILDREVIGEGVDEEDDLPAVVLASRPFARRDPQVIALPARGPAPPGYAQNALEPRWREELGQVGERAELRDGAGIARKICDQTISHLQGVPRAIGGERLDLEPRHVHARRTLALAALARDAELERRVHRLAAEILRAET